jgi:hypothetical protein
MDRKQDRWKAVCERLIRAVDPGFDPPCYFVTRREAKAGGILETQEFAGLTGIGMSGDLRRLLERQGRWHGRGFAAIIDLSKIDTTAGLEAILLHEFGHHLEAVAGSRRFVETIGRAAFEEILSTPSATLGIERPAPSHDAIQSIHGPPFFRLCRHLELRALWRLNRFPFTVDSEFYGWPARSQFWRALGTEPWDLAKLPMVQVAAMEPPESYRDFSAAVLAAQRNPS